MGLNQSKREISRVHLLFISFAAIFGSGWLFAPLYAAQIAGPASLVAWVLGAAMSAVIGITMAEVVVLFPQTGGLSQISKVTHGEFLSLLITLLNLLVFIILPAIEVRAVLQYLDSYFHFFMNTDHSITGWGYLFSLVLFCLINLVNLYGARTTANLTKLVVLFKVVTPLLLCVSFLGVLGATRALDFSRLAGGASFSWTQIFQAIATSGIIFSFNGFNQATFFAGEAKNPQKAIPFAILGSLLVSGLLYFIIQYVFLMSVPQESFARGWSHLAFAGDEGPFAGIAALLGLGWLLTLIYVDAVVSPLGTAFSYASAAPRLFQALVEGSAFEKNFLKLNRYGISPEVMIVSLILEFLAFLFLPSLKAMIALLVAAFVLCYTVAPASLLSLRRTQPDLHRPFRVWCAPGVSFLSLFFSNLMVYSCGWIALRNLLCVSTVLAILFGALQIKKSRPGSIQNYFMGSGWFLFQLCAVSGLCFLGDFIKIPFILVLGGISFISALALGFSLLLNRL